MSERDKICQAFGSYEYTDTLGNRVTFVWDYVQNKARLKSEMTKDEIVESEKAKWSKLKDERNKRHSD